MKIISVFKLAVTRRVRSLLPPSPSKGFALGVNPGDVRVTAGSVGRAEAAPTKGRCWPAATRARPAALSVVLLPKAGMQQNPIRFISRWCASIPPRIFPENMRIISQACI